MGLVHTMLRYDDILLAVASFARVCRMIPKTVGYSMLHTILMPGLYSQSGPE